jgi:hypothetical protein
MRKLEITEIDSDCYLVETTDFQNDEIEYHWDSTTRSFYAQNKRTFKRVTLDYGTYNTIGLAIDFIMKTEREQRDAHHLAIVLTMADRRSRISA